MIGKQRLSHDTEPLGISVFLIILAFTMYMIPGLCGAPLGLIAAFLLPQQTQDFDLYTSSLNKYNGKNIVISFLPRRNWMPFFITTKVWIMLKRVNKLVMIDFTGHACVNCRKMEPHSPKEMYKYEISKTKENGNDALVLKMKINPFLDYFHF